MLQIRGDEIPWGDETGKLGSEGGPGGSGLGSVSEEAGRGGGLEGGGAEAGPICHRRDR